MVVDLLTAMAVAYGFAVAMEIKAFISNRQSWSCTGEWVMLVFH